MAINLLTYNDGQITPQVDALVQQSALSGNGFFYGGVAGYDDETHITISKGLGVIYGRVFEIDETNLFVQKPSTGKETRRIYITINLQAATPIEIGVEQTASEVIITENPDINVSGGEVVVAVATFKTDSATGIDNDTIKQNMTILTSNEQFVIHSAPAGENISTDPKYKKQGIWFFQTSNAPTGRPPVDNLNDGILIVIPSSADKPYYVKQFWFRNGSQNITEQEIYQRTCRNATDDPSWGSWRQYVTFGENGEIKNPKGGYVGYAGQTSRLDSASSGDGLKQGQYHTTSATNGLPTAADNMNGILDVKVGNGAAAASTTTGASGFIAQTFTDTTGKQFVRSKAGSGSSFSTWRCTTPWFVDKEINLANLTWTHGSSLYYSSETTITDMQIIYAVSIVNYEGLPKLVIPYISDSTVGSSKISFMSEGSSFTGAKIKLRIFGVAKQNV